MDQIMVTFFLNTIIEIARLRLGNNIAEPCTTLDKLGYGSG